MDALRWKTRIAVLWIISAVAMSAHMILLLIDPAALKLGAQWATTASQGEWMIVVLYWFVPLWLSFVTVAVKDPASRWVNAVAAIVVTLFNIWHFLMCGVPLLKGGPYAEAKAHHVLMVGSAAVATALIIWYAWKWPKKEA